MLSKEGSIWAAPENSLEPPQVAPDMPPGSLPILRQLSQARTTTRSWGRRGEGVMPAASGQVSLATGGQAAPGQTFSP